MHLKDDPGALISDLRLPRCMSSLLVDGGLRVSGLLYQLYGLALLCLLVRMTFDQSFGHGNLNHLLIVMVCVHLLGKGEPP